MTEFVAWHLHPKHDHMSSGRTAPGRGEPRGGMVRPRPSTLVSMPLPIPWRLWAARAVVALLAALGLALAMLLATRSVIAMINHLF